MPLYGGRLSSIRSADLENPSLELNTIHEVDRMTRSGDMGIRNLTYNEECIWGPHFEGKGGRRGHRSYNWKEPLFPIGSPL